MKAPVLLLRRDILIIIICCAAIAAVLVLLFAYSPLPFEIVVEGEPTIGKDQTPILLAIRGDDPNRTVPDGLPDKAKEALQRVFAKPDPALYVVAYVGMHGSTGYLPRINSIVLRRGIFNEWLVVNYSVNQPLGGATVMTYPFVIVRVNANVRAADVVFERQ